MKPSEKKILTLQIVQRVLPAVDVHGSDRILKAFATRFYSHFLLKDVADMVREDPAEFERFCRNYYLHLNKLDEGEFNTSVNLMRKADLEQLDRLINKALLLKANLLYLIQTKEDFEK